MREKILRFFLERVLLTTSRSRLAGNSQLLLESDDNYVLQVPLSFFDIHLFINFLVGCVCSGERNKFA